VTVDNSKIFLGEVILCYTFIEQFAKENNAQIDKEFFTVYAHGILHLLGFEHDQKMFSIQDAVSEKFCYNK
jgi:rRNA maturation RNase YbeY